MKVPRAFLQHQHRFLAGDLVARGARPAASRRRELVSSRAPPSPRFCSCCSPSMRRMRYSVSFSMIVVAVSLSCAHDAFARAAASSTTARGRLARSAARRASASWRDAGGSLEHRRRHPRRGSRRRCSPRVTSSVTAHGAKGDGDDRLHRGHSAPRSRPAAPPAAAASSSRRGASSPGAIRLRVERQPARAAKGATLAFSTDPAAYLPLVLTRFEGVELMNYSPFIYALDETQHRDHRHAARSTARPSAQHWWPWRHEPEAPSRDQLIEHGRRRACPSPRARVRRRRVAAAAELHPAVPLPERAHRGRDDRQLADVGGQPGALHATSPSAA